MKKVLVSTAVIAAIAALGGGYYLEADHQTSQQRVSETKTVVSKKAEKSSKSASSSDAKTEKSTATKSSSTADDSSTTATSDSSSSSTTGTDAQSSTDSTTTSSQAASSATTGTSKQSSSSATSSTAATQHLTTSQINDWAWHQVSAQYQGTTANKQNFVFNQYQQGGLVYVEVYENQNADVAHLAGRFRVNAKGQLEQQQLAQGDVWQVVSTQP